MVTGGPIWQYYNDQPWVDEPNQLSFGGDGRNTIIHELGHALGLAHPHDGGKYTIIWTRRQGEGEHFIFERSLSPYLLVSCLGACG